MRRGVEVEQRRVRVQTHGVHLVAVAHRQFGQLREIARLDRPLHGVSSLRHHLSIPIVRLLILCRDSSSIRLYFAQGETSWPNGVGEQD